MKSTLLRRSASDFRSSGADGLLFQQVPTKLTRSLLPCERLTLTKAHIEVVCESLLGRGLTSTSLHGYSGAEVSTQSRYRRRSLTLQPVFKPLVLRAYPLLSNERHERRKGCPQGRILPKAPPAKTVEFT